MSTNWKNEYKFPLWSVESSDDKMQVQVHGDLRNAVAYVDRRKTTPQSGNMGDSLCITHRKKSDRKSLFGAF